MARTCLVVVRIGTVLAAMNPETDRIAACGALTVGRDSPATDRWQADKFARLRRSQYH